MVREIVDASANAGKRRVTFEYELNNPSDRAILNQISEICSNQPQCYNCTNMEQMECIGLYFAMHCSIHGNIEAANHPRHDMDGSKCPDYKRSVSL